MRKLSKKDFDAQIIVVIDKEITPEDPPETLIFSEGAEIGDYDFLKLLSRHFQYKNRAKNDPEMPVFMKNSYEKDFRNLYRQLQRRHGKEIARTVLEGRLKMSVLLDTDGGAENTETRIIDAMDHVAARGGITQTFVPRRAYSAGAFVFGAAQERNVLPESSMMWHLSNISSGETPVDVISKKEKAKMSEEQLAEIKADFEENRQEEKKKEIAAMRNFFEGVVSENKKPLIRAMLSMAENDGDNPDMSLWFTGREFNDLGGVTHLFPDVAAMREHFNSSTGICDNKAINTFFWVSGIAMDPRYHETFKEADYLQIMCTYLFSKGPGRK